MNAWKVILAALVIYGAGIATGHFAAGLNLGQEKPSPAAPRQVVRPRPPMMHDLMQRMESRLELNNEQLDQVRTIVESSQERMRELMDDVRPKFEAESQSMREQIEALLTEEQMAKFDRVFEHSGRPRRGGPNGRPQGPFPGSRGPGGGRRGGERFDRGGPRPENGEFRPPGNPVRPLRPPMESPSE